MVFPPRNQMPRTPQPPFRNEHFDYRGLPREMRNINGVGRGQSKSGSRGLSSLLPGSSGQGLAQSGGLSKLSKTLGGVQQVLGVVQSTAPLIQEYGPMVKNIPTMYRMMKAFKTFSKEDSEEPAEDISQKESPTNPKEEMKNYQEDLDTKEIPKRVKEKGLSKPKLYI